ncbi:MAG: Bug family tripartite tricarboxylate transporter substrate binding protein [Burkholderiales bacterium]
MRIDRVTRLLLSAVLAAMAVPAGAQKADGFPNRPVRLIIPYAPGGATDTTARPLAEKLRERWGYAVIVDNRAGASGNIALEIAANAAPDGHTLLVGNVSTNAINESIFKTKVKASRDLTGVTNLIELPHIWAVNPTLPVSSLREFVDYAKKSPKPLAYASAGVGSYPHLDALVLLKQAGIQMTHVPYKGGAGQMVPAIMGNEIQFMFINLGSTIAHVRTGRIKALATSWPTRRPELPDLPTVAEAGYPGMGTNAWNGLFAPAKIPPALLKRIFTDVAQVMEMQDTKDMLAKSLMSVVLNKSPAEYQQFVESQARKWEKVVAENNVKVE